MLKSTEAYKQVMTAIECLEDTRDNDRNERGKFIHSVFELEVAENKLSEALIWIEQYSNKESKTISERGEGLLNRLQPSPLRRVSSSLLIENNQIAL